MKSVLALSTLSLLACMDPPLSQPTNPIDPSDPVAVVLPSSPTFESAPTAPTTTAIAMITSTGPLIAWDFGLLQVGGSSPALVLTVVNNTLAVSDVLQVSFSGNDAGQFTLGNGTDCVGGGQIRLAPGSSCSIRPRFTPSTSGAKATNLTINGGVAGSASILLSGTGAPMAVLNTQPPSFAFNVVEFGHPATTTFSLVNAGVSVVVQSIAIDGSSTANMFSIASTTCTGTLAANASCTIDVQFNPQKFGENTGNLTVMTDHGPYGVGNLVNGWGGARLTVQTAGTGVVASDGGGYPNIFCGTVTQSDWTVGDGTDCSGLFISADHALAASGDFFGWGGACSGTAASCLVTLSTTTETVVTASFAP
jgi:hypothetical protein